MLNQKLIQQSLLIGKMLNNVNNKNIIQHYNPNDHQDIIRLINGFNEVEDK